MTDVVGLEDLLLLLLAALIPALVYLSWVRGSERIGTQPWSTLLGRFFYGALFATVVAGVLELVLLSAGAAISQDYPGPEFTFLNPDSPLSVFFLVLVVAPVVEEGLKAWGVVRAGDQVRLVSDALVFGAAVGLGFGFFETFLYGLGAYATDGLAAGLGLIVVRSFSSVLLHGSTTAMFGYGYGEMRVNGRGGMAGAYYLVAVVMHSAFNALASLGAIVALLGFSTGLSDDASIIGLVLVFVYAYAAIQHATTVIHRTDQPSAYGAPRRFQPPPVNRERFDGPPRSR